MHYIDHKYVNLISVYLSGWKPEGNDIYRFRCPFCGDSQKRKNKRRGYFYTFEESVNFFCHNCGKSISLHSFIKEISPELASQFTFEKFIEPKKRVNQSKEVSHDLFKTDVSSRLKMTNKILGRCQRIDGLPKDHPARQFLDKRLIPEENQKDLYYTDDANVICKSIPRYEEKRFVDDSSCIIIPFFDEEDTLVYLQCRFLAEDAFIRYMTFEVEEESHKIFGINKVDWTKPVWVFEGPFDSMFVPNSIACAGASGLLSEIKYLKSRAKAGFILVFDRDYESNYDVFPQLKKAIDLGQSVVMFDRMFPGKDANDAIKSGWDVKQLEKYLKDRTCSGLKAKLALTTFKPPQKVGTHGKESNRR